MALILLPVPIGEADPTWMPPVVISYYRTLEFFIVEQVRTARRMLKAFDPDIDINRITFMELDKHHQQDPVQLLAPASAGHSIGLMSESGLPGVADPGGFIVAAAHRMGIQVVPLPGPSSLMLALMASGMNGQDFRFHGYLPAKKPALFQAIQNLDREMNRYTTAHLFIEVPYRNESLFQAFLEVLSPDTGLCLAVNLGLTGGWVRSQTIRAWKKELPPDLHKQLCVFAVGKLL
ncbi:MAG TPA: SAM-dependent methyltransferase [Saprospiraceae bacterium]|nr:SAM-dependent methyltransferase [Saprospiraceae bacterium]